jgi:hypothetical protein
MLQAEDCRRQGQIESAQHIYEKIQQLCPGSRYAKLATRCLQQLRAYPITPSLGDLLSETRSPVLGSFYSGGQYFRLTDEDRSEESLKVHDLLENYWKACAEGRMSEATQWAVQALALDPACFTKARGAGAKMLRLPRLRQVPTKVNCCP